MPNLNDAFYQLRNELQPLYGAQEAAAIAHEVMFHLTGMDKLQRLVEKEKQLSATQDDQLAKMLSELKTGRPMQYVLGHAWFMGREFNVNEHVLIPRPETEELVQWIVDDIKEQNITLLDIGTGSGCIPISLKLTLRDANITSCDISEYALQVAQENVQQLGAEVNFIQLDFLQSEHWQQLGSYDVIVSNPPYIPVTERETLHTNVRDFEPELALFVPGNDAQLFYREIAAFGKTHLKTGGTIYCELHVDYAEATQRLFEEYGYKATIKKDMHGNLRMLKAV
ncbi:peptide chain release factor N(5)-glutamine methyltransferase [Polluticoccus soli]|uniref:peptide chain release factor N(5)-glutamine methyltransferase n=1 Tax=Polluticoccus soli TaxID=3034150 RepID=UPI0023E16E9D|nr:peptide chain release factor N(5)-glutamine methyltransferase [Flavipsychrobacter sp. JY13-12]